MADPAGPADRHALPRGLGVAIAREVDAVRTGPGALVEAAVAPGQEAGGDDDAVADAHHHLHVAHHLLVEDVAELVRLGLARALDVVVDLVEDADAAGLELAHHVEPATPGRLLQDDDVVVVEDVGFRRVAEPTEQLDPAPAVLPDEMVGAEDHRGQEAPVVGDDAVVVPADEDGLGERAHPSTTGLKAAKLMSACLRRSACARRQLCSPAHLRPRSAPYARTVGSKMHSPPSAITRRQ